MALIVQKYGGTSVGNPERIQNVARRVLASQREGNRVVVVVSAMAGVTDNLLGLAKRLSSTPTAREIDVLLATGEQTTIALLAIAINGLGGKGISLTGAQAGISTDSEHTRARIANITPKEVLRLLDEGNIVIIAGFQGQTPDGRITTLGRGGSDLSAIAMAAAIGADTCQIFTDVDGVYTCDPRLVPNARKIDEICYDEMLEMASSGSKVMQSRSVEFAKKFGVVFEVRSSLNNHPGTVVMEEKQYMEAVVVRGVFWVTRAKENLRCRVVKKRQGKAIGKILRDEEVLLKVNKSRRCYPERLRRVTALVEIDGEEREMVFLTNNFHWAASSVAELYRCRWRIEVFFKQIKQTLKISDFLGNSANAVRWQMWTALLAYVLLRFQAWVSNWGHSFLRLWAVARSNVWDKIDLRSLLESYGRAQGSFRCLGNPEQAYLEPVPQPGNARYHWGLGA